MRGGPHRHLPQIAPLHPGGQGDSAAKRGQSGHHPERHQPADGGAGAPCPPSLYEAAALIGQTIRTVISRDGGQQQGHINFGCNILLGGRSGGAPPPVPHLSGGQLHRGERRHPYFQIGESKYGKPIIDRIIHHETPLQTALQCALISIDSTLRSNLSVGLPWMPWSIHEGQLLGDEPAPHHRTEPHFVALRKAWGEGLQQLFQGLPPSPLGRAGGAKALSRSFLSGYSGCLPFRWSFPCAASTSCSTAAG